MPIERDNVIAFLANDLGVAVDDIDDDTLLFTDGYLDSFSIVELISYLETHGGIAVEGAEVTLDNLDSVARILRYVHAKTQ